MIKRKLAMLVLLVCTTPMLVACQDPFSTHEGNGFKFITGVVESGVESDCWILISTSGKSYELYGEKSSEIKKQGLRVTIMGKILDNPTTCMQGTPFLVVSYEIAN